jgi:transposase
MSVYVGMDVHRKRSQVAIVDTAGDQLRNRNLANDPAKLLPILGTLPPGTPVAFEAAYGWGWLVELLEELELEPHLVHPSRCKAIAAARLKNDKVDAATLAQLLRADLLPEAWIAPQATRDLRALLRHRASLVRLSTSLKNRVHAVLADRGIGEDQVLWTGPGRAWLAGLELPPTPRAIIEDCCGLLDALAIPIVRLEGEIAAGAQLRPQGPPRPHHQTGLALGAGDPAGGRPDGQAPPHVRQRLRRAGPAPRQPHRHHRDRSAAAGPLLPHPDPAGGNIGEGWYRARSRFRMSLQHGR